MDFETRFMRALFGLAPSPFLLGNVIKHHLNSWETCKPDAVAELHESLYVDDLTSGGATVEEAKDLKKHATFTLHKWHLNTCELDESPVLPVGKETYAKQQLGKPNRVESSLLGLGWNKEHHEKSASFPEKKVHLTKRGYFTRFVSPVTLEGKLLYCAKRSEKIMWDVPLTASLQLKWKKWEDRVPKQVAAVCPLAEHRHPIESIPWHGFGDTSGHGVGAAVYTVVKQESGLAQHLVAAKARLAKQGLTIP